jgi:hypothetical protein
MDVALFLPPIGVALPRLQGLRTLVRLFMP